MFPGDKLRASEKVARRDSAPPVRAANTENKPVDPATPRLFSSLCFRTRAICRQSFVPSLAMQMTETFASSSSAQQLLAPARPQKRVQAIQDEVRRPSR